jgi:hypothetical protein
MVHGCSGLHPESPGNIHVPVYPDILQIGILNLEDPGLYGKITIYLQRMDGSSVCIRLSGPGLRQIVINGQI